MKSIMNQTTLSKVIMMALSVSFISQVGFSSQREIEVSESSGTRFFKALPRVEKDPEDETKTIEVEPLWQDLVDFAEVDRKLPLGKKEHLGITVGEVTTWSQDQILQLYARLRPGKIPVQYNKKTGTYDAVTFDGTVVFASGGFLDFFQKIMRTQGITIGNYVVSKDTVGDFAESLWKGKRFETFAPQTEEGSPTSILRNMFDLSNTPSGVKNRGILAAMGVGLAKQATLLSNPDKGREGTKLVMPAKVHCGQSLLDSRRESIIIDYAFGDDIETNTKGYKYENLDYLAGRQGLKIRDEIRQVRPGFYVGIAYIDRIPVLNFILYNESIDKAFLKKATKSGSKVKLDEITGRASDCWSGEEGLAD